MIVFSIIGALIGAGFASGQEMYLFFYQYGINGIIGLVFCSILIGLVIYKTFSISYNNKISNYNDFLHFVFYKNKPSPKYKFFNLSFISNIIVNIFLLITFYIMISGFGAYFKQQFNINNFIGSAFLAVICFFILIKDIKGVAKVNSIIVPILIIIIGILGVFNLFQMNMQNISKDTNLNWIFQPFVYCSYNMILVMPILVNLSHLIKNKKQIKTISILSSCIIFILGLIIYLLLTNINTDISKIEMPAVYAISIVFPKFQFVYGIVILLSIFSTAISMGISFLKNIIKDKKTFPQFVGIMCISSVLISNIGFSNLIKMLFPLFGYLGIVQILFLLKRKL